MELIVQDVLLTIAEVAATLAAFSGLVAAFRARGVESWSIPETVSLCYLIVSALAVLLFALLPLLLRIAGWSESTIWGTASALLGVFFLSAAASYPIVWRRFRLKGRPETTPRLNLLLVALTSGLATLLLLSSLNLLVTRGPAAYVGGLIAGLAFPCVFLLQFVWVLARQRRDAD